MQAPAVSPVALLGGLGMVAVAVGCVIYARRRGLGWRHLGLGALAWVVTVALKFAWAVPVNTPVYQWLYQVLPEALAGISFYVYVGLLTGVFEVGVVWLVMRYTRLGRATWEQALAFGIGFGAVEALLLGFRGLGIGLAALTSPAELPLGPAELAQMNDVWYQLAPIAERFFAVLVHVLSNALIFYAVATRKPRWFWLALLYKSGIDAVAAGAQLQGWTAMPWLWAVEGVVVLWGVVGWLGARWVERHYPQDLPENGAPEAIEAARDAPA
jgi:uncharacterized membrane protein YhfC